MLDHANFEDGGVYNAHIDNKSTTEHPHAECLRHIAEHKFDGRVVTLTQGGCLCASPACNPLSRPDLSWFIKPATVVVNGKQLPEPLRVAPKPGTTVFRIAFSPIQSFKFSGTVIEPLNLGVLHRSEADVQAWITALTDLMRGKS